MRNSEDGSTTSNPDEMAAIHRRYWGTLYRSHSRNIVSTISPASFQPLELIRLLHHTSASISADTRSRLDASMTANDFYRVIITSPTGRTSGLDGLPIEYYKLSPHEWAKFYELVYAKQLRHGRMTKFLLRASITLL